MSINLKQMSLEEILDLYYTMTRTAPTQYDIITLLSQEIVSRVKNKEYTQSSPIDGLVRA